MSFKAGFAYQPLQALKKYKAMQNSKFILPKGIVLCNVCGCAQPLSATTVFLDGHMCDVHKPPVDAQLSAEAKQRHRFISQQSKQGA